MKKTWSLSTTVRNPERILPFLHVLKEMDGESFDEAEQDVILMPDPVAEDFLIGNRIGYFSAIKTSVLKSIGGYSPRMTWGFEDYHLWFDLLKRGNEIVTIPEVLVLYRTKEHSMIHDANKHSKELMDQIIKDHKEVWQK